MLRVLACRERYIIDIFWKHHPHTPEGAAADYISARPQYLAKLRTVWSASIHDIIVCDLRHSVLVVPAMFGT